MSQKVTELFSLMMLGFAAALLLGTITFGHEWGDDFAGYILQAKSIVEWSIPNCIETNRFTMQQSTQPLGPVTYPWGFPTLLAPLYAVFGLNMVALKSVGIICYLLFLLLLWKGFRRYHSNSGQLALLSIFAFNPEMLCMTDTILSDIPFLLFSTAGILLMGRVLVDRQTLLSPGIDVLMLGTVLIFSCCIRTNGILLLLVLPVALWLSVGSGESYGQGDGENLQNNRGGNFLRGWQLYSHYKKFITCLLLLVTVSGLVFLAKNNIALFFKHNSITFAKINRSFDYYIYQPAELFKAAPHKKLIYGATIPLAIAGACSRFRRDSYILIYIIFTFLLYVILPTLNQGPRYLYPILPFYISFVVTGLESYLSERSDSNSGFSRKIICTLSILLVVYCSSKWSVCNVLNTIHNNSIVTDGPCSNSAIEMFKFVQLNTDSKSIIVFFKPRAMTLNTSRKSIMVTRLKELPYGDYVCLYLRDIPCDQLSKVAVGKLIKSGAFERIYRNDDFALFRLNHDKLRDLKGRMPNVVGAMNPVATFLTRIT